MRAIFDGTQVQLQVWIWKTDLLLLNTSLLQSHEAVPLHLGISATTRQPTQ